VFLRIFYYSPKKGALMIELQYTILLPIIAGIILFLFPEKAKPAKGIITVLVSCAVLYYSYKLFRMPSKMVSQSLFPSLLVTLVNMELVNQVLIFNIDNLGKTIALFIGFFGFMISLYSLSYITRAKKIHGYYSNFLITVGSAIGAVLANHFLLFITFWGILGLTLYKLIKGNDEKSSAAAKKTFILIGASDSIMIFGIGLLWVLTDTMKMSDISVGTTNAIGVIAFITLLIGSLTKAGAFPLHTWVPDYAETAPASSSAFLPASLDKLLGIYFLARISMNLFVLNQWLHLVLLIIGVITIITAVLMALIQHSYKRLLGFHAVSQVGYMVTGLGLGTPIGIAGGLFHMMNHALYKSGLFLTAGSVEKRTGKEDLEDVGGLSSVMPLTFVTALICAMSISGVPPFNGFASKWLIYQAIIEFGQGTGPANKVWIVWLILAVFGSALTLASFIKFISGIYLGSKKKELKNAREVSILMWLPQIIIALLCTGIGIMAHRYVIPTLIQPITGEFQYQGIWSSGTITGLVVVSIVLGFIIYLFGNLKKFRTAEGFAGGELLEEQRDFSSVEFYKTISSFKPFAFFYKRAEKGATDLYDQTKNAVLGINKMFSKCHAGILPLYALWVILGLIIIALVLLL
ncbi:MAG: NADH-quinone oxidoreductase subunit L, partial [Spirochaetota bacterium]